MDYEKYKAARLKRMSLRGLSDRKEYTRLFGTLTDYDRDERTAISADAVIKNLNKYNYITM